MLDTVATRSNERSQWQKEMFRYAQHDKIPCVIASEQRERGKQQARNPDTVDCHEAKPLAMTGDNDVSSIHRRLIATLAMMIGNIGSWI